MSNCLTCGLCCASFRVDFSLFESEDLGGDVPAGLTVKVNQGTCRMRGTDHSPARCAALIGQVGHQVTCGIYEWRPSPCHEFSEGSEVCQRLRSRGGMLLL